MSRIINYLDKIPDVSCAAFVGAGSMIIGDVTLLQGSSVWYNCVLRGDVNSIRIGRYTNIQDGCVLHADSGRSGLGDGKGLPTILGDKVTVGHRCVLHACTIEDECLIGMGAIVLDGAVVGRGSVVAAGAVVTKGMVLPPFSLAVGVPAKIVKTLEQASSSERLNQAQHYYQLAVENREGCERGE